MASAEQEEWRPIPSCPGYEASSLGRIRSNDCSFKRCDGKTFRRKGKVLSLNIDTFGRPRFTFKGKRIGACCAVSEAFFGFKPKGTEVCHNNGNPADNRPENLRYDSRSNNTIDRYIHGVGTGKLTIEIVKQIRGSVGVPDVYFARQFQVKRQAISAARRGLTWAFVT